MRRRTPANAGFRSNQDPALAKNMVPPLVQRVREPVTTDTKTRVGLRTKRLSSVTMPAAASPI
jgi:hypothetical protein